ncbi:hypothetical protein CXB51_021403 [Gossypium anomalum]|uniref:Uncharacterized protein n=1 Tax=Gossypium anomalum TaxID=47600 RepID=A0A8J5ZC01_9ROSI|nr:hypothetical protein CXB51_021403 [Gossypium anomalum]
MSSSISLLVYLPYLEVLLFILRCVFLISSRRHTFLSLYLLLVPSQASTTCTSTRVHAHVSCSVLVPAFYFGGGYLDAAAAAAAAFLLGNDRKKSG